MQGEIMGDKEKTKLQTAIDLLEENGFHVFKAEEETPSDRSILQHGKRTILLRIIRHEDMRKD
jgi:hypothetical protein